MQNTNQLTINTSMQDACNIVLATTHFPTLTEWQRTLDTSTVVQQQSEFVKQYIEEHQQENTMLDKATLQLQALDAFKAVCHKPYTDGFVNVVNSFTPFGLVNELHEKAVTYYNKWHEFNTVGEFILHVNHNHCTEVNVAKLTKRDLNKQSSDVTKKQSASDYNDYIDYCRQVKQDVAEAKLQLKQCKKQHELNQANLIEEQRAELAQLKLKHQQQSVELSELHTSELIDLQKQINRTTPATFEAYKQMTGEDS